MNNIDVLSKCRGCGSGFVRKTWTAPPLPIHLWPLPEGVTSIDERTSVFVCQSCGLAQLNDMSIDFVEQLYDKGLCVLEEQGQQHLRKDSVTDWAGRDFFAGKRILELGGGTNTFLQKIPEAGERWIADLVPDNIPTDAADHLVVGNFETLDLPGISFDVICGFLIWEHFINPLTVTQRVADLLSDKGLLLVEVPNLLWLCDELPHYLVFHQHQSIFTVQTLDRMMSLAGLTRQALFSENQVIFAAYARGDVQIEPADADEIAKTEDSIRRATTVLESVEPHVCNHTPTRIWKNPTLYGAGGSMSLFLAYSPELRARLIGAFDNDPRKHGRYVPGTVAKVRPPEAIADFDTDGALVLANYMRDLGIAERFPDHITVTDIIEQLKETAD